MNHLDSECSKIAKGNAKEGMIKLAGEYTGRLVGCIASR